jgi:rhodanese-related sulfurtransferase
VLPRDEYDQDHLPGALHLPLRQAETAHDTALDRSRPVIVSAGTACET